LLGVAGSVAIGIAIAFVGRFHRAIMGGYSGASSDDGRKMQWVLAWPHILSNPITGHGLGESGTVIGWTAYPGGPLSVDSYVLSLLVDAGVPAVVFFFGITLLSAWTGARLYLRDPAGAGALSVGLASSLVAFSVYKLFLSQTENMTLMFMMVACVALLKSFFDQAKEQPASPTHHPAQWRG
jgi:O-antigen ligase